VQLAHCRCVVLSTRVVWFYGAISHTSQADADDELTDPVLSDADDLDSAAMAAAAATASENDAAFAANDASEVLCCGGLCNTVTCAYADVVGCDSVNDGVDARRGSAARAARVRRQSRRDG
jgi:hypothetical protein